MADTDFKALFQVLSNEQQLLQRADQKAYTMLSIIAVWMMFFIVHYMRVPPYRYVLVFMGAFFFLALCSIGLLLAVITPRITHSRIDSKGKERINPTFFGGIVHFKNPEEFSKALHEAAGDDEHMYTMFADSVYRIAHINHAKSKNLRRAIVSFVLAVTVQLCLVFYVYMYRFFHESANTMVSLGMLD